jgi:hypothetical protein
MQVVLNGVVAVDSEDKVSGDELSALVDELEERVLSIGARLAKEDWASSVANVFAVTSDGLAIRLHRQLLEVSWEAVHILVKSKESAAAYKS